MTKSFPKKKRHHFVPVAYLKAFANKQGRVLVYRKDDPSTALPVTPRATAFENYYNSQPTPDGGMDHDRLEDMFCELEGKWPPLVKMLQARADVNALLETLFQFVLLQRVRVPASRDATEARLAAEVRQTLQTLFAAGELPPLPLQLPNGLDDVSIAIDPHRSLHGMAEEVRAANSVFNRIGFCVVHNQTSTPFLTSDNPVIWFDSSLPLEDQKPYGVQLGGPVQLIFPISPTMVLLGSTELSEEFGSKGLQYGSVTDDDWVFRVNLDVCRYAYAAVYASAPGMEELIKAFADESPVWQHDGKAGRLAFAPRVSKPKWLQPQDDK